MILNWKQKYAAKISVTGKLGKSASKLAKM